VSTMDVGVSLLKLAGGRYAKPVDGRDFTPLARRAEGLLTRWLPDDDERAFLITGNPWYSRSLLLVQGDQWYIRNFDHIYRTATVATPAPPAGTATWNAAPREANSDDSVTYRIPFSRYEPFSVTIDHVAARPGCKAELNVLLAPGVAYLREAAPFDTSIRVTIPAARRDVLTVAVKPASCAGATVYSVSRYEAPQTSTLTTTFASSLVARKLRTENEMYNAASDPFMTKNLIPAQSAKPYADKLRAVYEAAVAASGKQAVTRTLSDEELRKLRSLGYIQ
ncbi:MAG TPA: hypothetical protein VE010_04690, partial [Thermoanaerobaculia bacterium]|nr:hypothetical protein [Thermoanaerobaculia bacterium]